MKGLITVNNPDVVKQQNTLRELASYRIAMKPVKLQNGVFACGRCHKRINRKHDFCHRCGQCQAKN